MNENIFQFTDTHFFSSTLEIIINILSHILLCKLCNICCNMLVEFKGSQPLLAARTTSVLKVYLKPIPKAIQVGKLFKSEVEDNYEISCS